MTVLVLGLSHKTAPVAQREKAALSEGETRGLLRDLTATAAVAEVVAISTCNRTEVYVASESAPEAEGAVARALVERTHITADELSCARYLLRDERAAAQLFRVTSSLDSMVIGESEIQAQVRSAWDIAREEGSAGPRLNHLFRQALEVGKSVRSNTGIGTGSASVSAVAVDLCEQVLELPGRRVLVIGAGQMAEATAAALVRHGVREVVVANRTVGTARELAARVGGRGVGFDALAEQLRAADIVISSTDAPHPVLRHVDIAAAMDDRGGRAMVIVDIAVPRDVEAAVGGIEGVALFDIDDLERVVQTNLNGRRQEAIRGETLVLAAVDEFSAWARGLAATPAIARLHARAEQIRRAELERVEAGWQGLTDEERARLEMLTRGIVQKLLHEPTVRVREAAQEGDSMRHLDSLRHLFGLEAPQRQ